jgi:hypothetical protein
MGRLLTGLAFAVPAPAAPAPFAAPAAPAAAGAFAAPCLFVSLLTSIHRS